MHSLNFKGEYERCRIHRLTVGEENKKAKNCLEEIPQNAEIEAKGEHYLMSVRMEKDKNSRRNLKGNVSVIKQKKRNMLGEETTRSSKKKKIVLIGELQTNQGNWV